VIEYMLRMYVMDKPSKWEDYLHLVEFSYNNGYQASLNMSPFEELYGRKCNTLVSWDNRTDREVDYMIALTPSMFVHNVFHVSLLKKYIPDANHVIDWNVIQVEQEGAFQVHLVHILN
jgi:hypothetical protein